jgi:D-alanyl-D-alanine carboxypeptidase
MKKMTWQLLLCLILGYSLCNSQPDSTPKITNAKSGLSSKDSASAVSILQARLNSILTQKKLSNAKASLMVYSLDSRKTYYQKNADDALTPASTTKLFSTFAAFYTLGGTYGVPTTVYADAPITNGVIHGNLYLVGHGDALLTTSDIEDLADQIDNLGVKKITGTIYGDGTYFDNLTERHIYSGDHEVVEPLAPITGLGINRNTVTVMASPGNPPHVQTIPPSDAFVVVNTAQSPAPSPLRAVEPRSFAQSVAKSAPVITPKKTAMIQPKKATKVHPKASVKAMPHFKGKKSPVVHKKGKVQPKHSGKKSVHSKKRAALGIDLYNPLDDIHNLGDAPPAPRKGKAKAVRASFSVSASTLPNGGQQFITRGAVGRGGLHTSYYVIKKPELAAAGTLRNRLKSGGIEVVGGVGVMQKPANAQKIAEFHRPVAEIIGLVNKNSDNFLAEHIFKMVGAAAGGQTNTAKKSIATITEALQKAGISTEGLCINDGSGLCRRNLFSANTEVGLLTKAAESNFALEFKSSLSIAGVDGTLKRRMKQTYAERNLQAKTGTLRNASALSGYVTTRDGERLCFAFIFNGGSVGLYKQTENELGAALAEFSFNSK